MENRKYTSVTICLQGLAHYKPILVSHFCKWYKLPECQMHKLFTACPPHGHLLALRRAAAVLSWDLPLAAATLGRAGPQPAACSASLLQTGETAQPSPAQPSPAHWWCAGVFLARLLRVKFSGAYAQFAKHGDTIAGSKYFTTLLHCCKYALDTSAQCTLEHSWSDSDFDDFYLLSYTCYTISH